MTRLRYLWRSMVWHRRSQVVAVLGAALATAALTGALLTGHSVRHSLRSLVLGRLGATDYVLSSRGFFRAELARVFQPEWRSCALVMVEGTAAHQRSGQRAAVTVYGVDDSFHEFHGSQDKAPQGGEAWLSPGLAAEFGVKAGDGLTLRVEQPSPIPRESLQGRKEQTAALLSLRVAQRISPATLGDFALRPEQGEVKAVFVSLSWLQSELKVPGQANLVLLAGSRGGEELAQRLRAKFRLEDAGLRLRHRAVTGEMVLEHESTILDDRTADRAMDVAKELGVLARPSLVYLANTISVGARAVPYSVVTALDEATLAEIHQDLPLPKTGKTPILLNDWSAMDLGAKQGDTVTLEYYVWVPDAGLRLQKQQFELAGVVPIAGFAADRDFVPVYPGISEQKLLAKWDAPFPMDRRRVQPRDEMYWNLFRTTPKAWIPLDAGRKLWGTKFGSYTSVRFMQDDAKLAAALRAEIDPLAGPFTLTAVRRQSLEAAAGSTDFGEYFLYFSSFVLFAALLLMVLFLRMGVEQRAREVGLLLALGSQPKPLLLMFLVEGLVVALAGAAMGAMLAPAYAEFILLGLKTWWRGATGTQLLQLSLDARILAVGAASGAVLAVLGVWMALHDWDGLAPKVSSPAPAAGGVMPRWLKFVGWGTLGVGLCLVALALARKMPARGTFFAAGLFLLASSVIWSDWLLRRPFLSLVGIPGKRALVRLAVRNLAWRRGRTVLMMALIAPCAFLLVSMEAFRQKGRVEGTGGYELYGESLAPLVYDANTGEGAQQLNLQGLAAMKWVRFRLQPGDDVSCLNLYVPRNSRILGVPESFLRSNRFQFTTSTGESAETRANPWLLLESQMNSGTIPAIIDQNSLAYVLHKKVGDEVEVEREGAPPLRLRLVAALKGSVFQSELLISEKNFVRMFPQIAGWRVFLMQGPVEAAGALEEALAQYGFEAQPAAERLAGYHRVENTYLDAFQTLGGLGLLLGTAGLGVVMLRNVWDRRRELALLRAAGFGDRELSRMILLETVAVLAVGLGEGCLCALVAVLPALSRHESGLPVLEMLGVLVLIFGGGLVAAWLAARAAVRMPILGALRAQ